MAPVKAAARAASDREAVAAAWPELDGVIVRGQQLHVDELREIGTSRDGHHLVVVVGRNRSGNREHRGACSCGWVGRGFLLERPALAGAVKHFAATHRRVAA